MVVKSIKKRGYLLTFVAFVMSLSLVGATLCAEPAQRIISLSPSVTEQLYQLGAQDRLVGCTVYCNRPRDAMNKEKVGTVIEVNLEKIVGLKPDLIIVTPLTNPKTITKLNQLGIKVTEFPSPENFDELCKQHLALAVLVGKEDVAKESINRARNDVRLIREDLKNLSKPAVFVQVGANPLVTVTKNSLINDFIEYAGGVNIASTTTTGLYSREEVVSKNPDVILIVTMGIVGEKEREIWKKYDIIKAVSDNRIHIIDSNAICSPTPESFVGTLKELVKILHPQLKAETQDRI